MGIFSNKNNKEFFEKLKNDAEQEQDVFFASDKPYPSHALTVDEVVSSENTQQVGNTGTSPLEALKKRMAQENPERPETEKNEPDETSLLEKLKPYTIDDDGTDLSVTGKPLYELESVAEILRFESEKVLNSLSKKYNITIDDLDKNKHSPDIKPKAEENENNRVENKEVEKTDDVYPTHTVEFKRMVKQSKDNESENLLNTLFHDKSKSEETENSIPDISDIDNSVRKKSTQNNSVPFSNFNTATVKFTPVKDKSNTNHIAITSITNQIDISDEILNENSQSNDNETLFTETEFSKYSPDCEFRDYKSGKSTVRNIAIKKRSAFIRLILSFLSALFCCLIPFTPLSDLLITDVKKGMIISGAALVFNFLLNCDIIISVKKLFGKTCTDNVPALFASVFTLLLTAFAVVKGENVYEIILLCSVILFTRSLCSFLNQCTLYGNLKQITMHNQKNGVTLIDDPASCMAMADNSIEGDILIAARQKTDFVEDYMKYSTYSAKLYGKLSVMSIAVLAVSLITGLLAFGYYSDALKGLYVAAVIMCLFALPSLFFIDTLPLFSASKHLNKIGAMIAGKMGAEKLEMANAAVISTSDIFPNGTVTLQDMMVLTDNNIDDIIMRAASVSQSVGSTLTPIFHKIAGTNNKYSIPPSDTVKYEKRLGISGWVNDQPLFIGNRRLLVSHGIEIPGADTDATILRKGYFPVYIACGNKACALLAVKYSVDTKIAKQLRYLSKLGVTLLVNNCDPNVNEDMLCDYLGLYEDSVKILSNAGSNIYKNTVKPVSSLSAPASFRFSDFTLVTLINSASKIKKSNNALSLIYIISSILGIASFIYLSFSSPNVFSHSLTALVFSVVASLVSLILLVFNKP